MEFLRHDLSAARHGVVIAQCFNANGLIHGRQGGVMMETMDPRSEAEQAHQAVQAMLRATEDMA